MPPEVRRFLERAGVVAAWQRAAAATNGRERSVRVALRLIAALSEFGALHLDRPLVELQSPSGRRDGRWELWQKLRCQAGAVADPQWSPFTATRVYDFTAEPALQAQRVELSFDARLSLGSVVGTLRRLWPRLREAGWVRQSHPLGARKLALVEFVCAEMAPDTSWRVILTAWNERYRRWPYRSVRGFEGDFHRAEESLTGERYGLEWFYRLQARPEVRGSPTWSQAMAMSAAEAKDGDRRYARRLFAPLAASSQRIALIWASRIRWAQERAAAGLSEKEIADELVEQLPPTFQYGGEEGHEGTALDLAHTLLGLDPGIWPAPEPGDSRVEYPPAAAPPGRKDTGRARSLERFPPMKADERTPGAG